jgi:colanic acid/amylovoran biosynthesis glycosyltransferase
VPVEPLRVAYVVKRYPRFSETFIVGEILALEALGVEIEVFSLYHTTDTHFHDTLARVCASVHYLCADNLKAFELWALFEQADAALPNFWNTLEVARGEDIHHVYQAIRLALEVRARGLRHIHAHFASAQTTVARLASRFAGVPYSFTAHAKDIYHKSVSGPDLRRKLEDASSAVTVSDYNLEYLRTAFPSVAHRVRRVYNGLDFERFAYFKPPTDEVRIVSVGRLVEKKGFFDLIDACAILQGRGQRFECQIVGSGPLEAQLRARIGALGLADRVRLLGPRPQAEVIELVRGATVFAAPCLVAEDGDRDGLPTVLLEAMALGTPCVATDVTGIPEVVRHEDTGLIVPQRDPQTLADALERLLRDREACARLAGHARALIEREFDARQNAARLREVFARAVQPERREVA